MRTIIKNVLLALIALLPIVYLDCGGEFENYPKMLVACVVISLLAIVVIIYE